MQTAVPDLFITFMDGQPLDDFDNAEQIRQQWVEIMLKKFGWEIQEAQKMETQGTMRKAMHLGERVDEQP
jgi:thioredoxin-like negative regulator of GroEL